MMTYLSAFNKHYREAHKVNPTKANDILMDAIFKMADVYGYEDKVRKEFNRRG